MPLQPRDRAHVDQIIAGTSGRQRGHEFENDLAQRIRRLELASDIYEPMVDAHLVIGDPAKELVKYIVNDRSFREITSLEAWWLGGLATSGYGDVFVDDAGIAISRAKSDVLVRITDSAQGPQLIGISVKTCNAAKPTNDQLFCSTAVAFSKMLRDNGLSVSKDAENALRMFCGDPGFRPIDQGGRTGNPLSDPDRWFWEELPDRGRIELEGLLGDHQYEISVLLLNRAYSGDKYPPDFILHQRTQVLQSGKFPLAIFTTNELASLSLEYGKFSTRAYTIRKGRYKGDPQTHLAPRFGFIQMQRLGNQQNATQLQFNLQAGYFNKLP